LGRAETRFRRNGAAPEATRPESNRASLGLPDRMVLKTSGNVTDCRVFARDAGTARRFRVCAPDAGSSPSPVGGGADGPAKSEQLTVRLRRTMVRHRARDRNVGRSIVYP